METKDLLVIAVNALADRDRRIAMMKQELAERRGFFTEAEMVKYVGERCDEQRPGCPVCRAWSRFDFINHLRHEDEGMRIQFEAEDAAEGKQ